MITKIEREYNRERSRLENKNLKKVVINKKLPVRMKMNLLKYGFDVVEKAEN
jgi:hypothetical protein